MNEQEIKKLFLELVQIDSHSLEEGQMATRCRAELESLGFSVEVDRAGEKIGGQTGNIIATLPGEDGFLPIMLAAHMDTVKPGQGVKPRVDADGVVWSDGTTILGADDKAGVTAIITAMRELVESGAAHGQIQVVFTIAEEIGLQGAKHLDAQLLSAKMGLSLDSGGKLGTIVIAGPTQAKWSAEFQGKAAHAGVAPEKGISAIKVAAAAVARMPHGRVDRETTVNVGTFIGEGPTNVVRDSVRLLGEARSLNPNRIDEVLEEIGQVFAETASTMQAHVNYEYSKMYSGFRFGAGEAVRNRIEAALRQAGYEPETMESGGGSDANIYTSLGIPTMNIGIGYEDIHSTGEHVSLANIRAAAEVALVFCTLNQPQA